MLVTKLFLLLVVLNAIASTPNYNVVPQQGEIEVIAHCEASFLFEMGGWRGGQVALQTVATMSAVVMRDRRDVVVIRRTPKLLYITLRSSDLTLECKYNMWGMFTFSLTSYANRFAFSNIDMSRCMETTIPVTDMFKLLEMIDP